VEAQEKAAAEAKTKRRKKNVQARPVVSPEGHQVAPSSTDVIVFRTHAFVFAAIILLALLFLPAPYAKVSSPWHGMP
jgi:hypothetical protein